MRKSILLLLLVITSELNAQVKTNDTWSSFIQSEFTIVERNNDGTIKSVRYAATDDNRPVSADEFFSTTLKKRDADDFIMDRSSDTDYGMHFERYQQYYQGILVDDGHYNFRFKNGRMKGVKGHYVNVTGINPIPSITEKEAINLYASYFGIEKRDTIESYVRLMIKEIPNANKIGSVAALTYKVFLQTVKFEGTHIGYIDAHTGKLLYKEDAFCSAIGQFYTYYNRNANDIPKYGTTYYSNDKYLLKDTTRWDSIVTQKYEHIIPPEPISDNDNIWTRDEMGIHNIALDVHWTMEKIWDIMVAVFHHHSYDGHGCQVKSTTDNSLCDAYYSGISDYFVFGCSMGSTVFGPFGSVDIIGHEYGHGISTKTTNIGSYGVIQEGLADIWGIIFEKHITPSANYWKFGEQIMINGESCLRNFQNPNDATAHKQISSTYGCGLYNSSDPHVAGGILPYWFYLLVNGGSGTNGLNNSYQLIPVGFDLAESLFTNTALNTTYLEDCTTLQEVGLAFLEVAYDMNNSFLIEQVENSLYAVGLYTEPQHIYIQSCDGSSSTYYVYGNSNCSVNWSFIKTSGATPTLVPNSSNYSCTLYSSSSFSGNLYATINCGGCTATYSKSIYFAASPSSVGGDVMQILPIDGTHYQLSLDGEYERSNIMVYDASNLQIKANEKLINKNYVLDTSSWKRGLYIIEVTTGNKTSTTKLSVK